MPTRQGDNFSKKRENIATLQLPTEHYLAISVDAMDLKNRLREMEVVDSRQAAAVDIERRHRRANPIRLIPITKLPRKTDPNDPNPHLSWKLWRHEGAARWNRALPLKHSGLVANSHLKACLRAPRKARTPQSS